MKKQKLFIAILAVFFFNANVLLATSFQGEQNITISSAVEDDLYLAGGNVLISAPVRGDLVCAAGDVIIQDTIAEDVMLVGGTLKVMGYIGDDLRVAGGTVMVMSNVNGDLIIAGGEVTVGKDAVINGDILVAGGKLNMNGTAKGKVNLRGGEISWNGIAEKDFTAKAGSLVLNGMVQGKSQLAAQKIELGNDAQFYGDVEYWSSEENLDFGNTLLSGATAFYNPELQINESDINWQYFGLGLVAFWIYRLLVSALFIALLIWMFHRFFYRNSEETNQNYASHLGYGFLYVIGLPLLITIAFVTVVGIPVGFVLMMFYGLTIALGHILASLLIAYGINFYYEKDWNRRMLFLVSISSYLALKIIGAIPLLGFVFSILVVMTAFGTILYIWWKNRIGNKSTVVD